MCLLQANDIAVLHGCKKGAIFSHAYIKSVAIALGEKASCVPGTCGEVVGGEWEEIGGLEIIWSIFSFPKGALGSRRSPISSAVVGVWLSAVGVVAAVSGGVDTIRGSR